MQHLTCTLNAVYPDNTYGLETTAIPQGPYKHIH